MLIKHFFPLLVISFFAIGARAQGAIYGKVVDAIDGQTIRITTSTNVDVVVQLRFTEAPDEGQPLADVVKEHLSMLSKDRAVEIRSLSRGDGPWSAVITVGGKNLGLQMVRDGAAWYAPEGAAAANVGDDNVYAEMQNAAKAERRGIWGIDGLRRPSEIRDATSKTLNPFSDAALAQMAWTNLGPAVEGVFGEESFTPNTGNCGGRVVDVVDGDTVKILTGSGRIVTVRLAGIDAPEKNQDFGMAAKASLSAMILNRVVSCSSTKMDRYGRMIGKLDLDGTDVNLQMVKSCMAWHYKEYEREQNGADRALYAQAESAGRAAGCGLWQRNAIRPSEFRRGWFAAVYTMPTGDSSPVFLGEGLGNSSGSSSRGGGPVRVRGYTRRDGTVVRPHTRSRP